MLDWTSFRFSFIGPTPELYDKWMYNTRGSNYELIKSNIRAMRDYVKQVESDCVIETYHLITDNNNLDWGWSNTKHWLRNLMSRQKYGRCITGPVPTTSENVT